MPIVDISFGLKGERIPADHGYPLYAALSKKIPVIHGDEEIGIHPVSGSPTKNRYIELAPSSKLTIRLDSTRIDQFLTLIGASLLIGDCVIQIGPPRIFPLIPRSRLYSRLVTIKGFQEPSLFLDAAKRQLDELDIKGSASLVDQSIIAAKNIDQPTGTHSPVLRRTVCIRDKEVVGFALRVERLTAEESIRLQEHGLGGRRRFGCGVFIPDRR